MKNILEQRDGLLIGTKTRRELPGAKKMENEQSANQKCLDFLESTESERQKISESLEDEFEVRFYGFLEKIAKI